MSSLTPAEVGYYKAHASDNRQPNMLAIMICGLILPYIAVAARFIARRSSAASVGKDDWMILLALVSHEIRRFSENRYLRGEES